MDIDKKTILAFILIGLIIIITQSDIYRKTFFPKSYEADRLRKEQRAKRLSELAAHGDSAQVITEPFAQSSDRSLPTKRQETKPDYNIQTIFQQDTGSVERIVKVSTPIYDVLLSTKGATIVSCRLKEYETWQGSFVEMIPPNAEGNLGINFSTVDTTVNTSFFNFELGCPTHYWILPLCLCCSRSESCDCY